MTDHTPNADKPSADRRTLRTRKLLRQALVELIEEKGLEGITVSDLTSRAEINRGTFYLHYKDVYDLLEQLQTEILEGLASLAMKMDFLELVKYAQRNEAYPALLTIFEYWNRHSDFCKAILGPKGDPSFAPRVKEMMKDKIYSKVVGAAPPERVDTFGIPMDYILAYMTSANIGLIQHWFESGKRQSPREIAVIMTRLVGQGPIVASGFLGGSSA